MKKIIGCKPSFFQGLERLYCESCPLKNHPEQCGDYINLGNDPIFEGANPL